MVKKDFIQAFNKAKVRADNCKFSVEGGNCKILAKSPTGTVSVLTNIELPTDIQDVEFGVGSIGEFVKILTPLQDVVNYKFQRNNSNDVNSIEFTDEKIKTVYTTKLIATILGGAEQWQTFENRSAELLKTETLLGINCSADFIKDYISYYNAVGGTFVSFNPINKDEVTINMNETDGLVNTLSFNINCEAKCNSNGVPFVPKVKFNSSVIKDILNENKTAESGTISIGLGGNPNSPNKVPFLKLEFNYTNNMVVTYITTGQI